MAYKTESWGGCGRHLNPGTSSKVATDGPFEAVLGKTRRTDLKGTLVGNHPGLPDPWTAAVVELARGDRRDGAAGSGLGRCAGFSTGNPGTAARSESSLTTVQLPSEKCDGRDHDVDLLHGTPDPPELGGDLPVLLRRPCGRKASSGFGEASSPVEAG